MPNETAPPILSSESRSCSRTARRGSSDRSPPSDGSTSPPSANRGSSTCRARRPGRRPVQWQVIVEVDGVRAGGGARPPLLRGEATRVTKRKVSEERLAEQLTAFIPDHLGSRRPHATGEGPPDDPPQPVPPASRDHDLRHRQPHDLPGHHLPVVDGRPGADEPRFGSGVMIGPRTC